MPVIDIRGTNGSGKSWIVHQLVKQSKTVTNVLDDTNKNIIGHVLWDLDCALVGKYTTACGGADWIHNANQTENLIRRFANNHEYVIVEGIMVSHTFKRYSNIATELDESDYGYIFCYLNTPISTCIARVKARQLKKNKKKPFNPKNLLADWEKVWLVAQRKCRESKHHVIVIDWRDPLQPIQQILSTKWEDLSQNISFWVNNQQQSLSGLTHLSLENDLS